MDKLAYIAAGIAIALGGYAFADYRAEQREEAQYATTLRVTPVTEEVKTPREECRDVRTTRYVKDRGNDTTGTIVGALVGGAIGNQVGGGNGRKAATAAGLVGGGLIGRRIDENNNPPKAVHSTQRKCKTVHDTHEEVVAYDVEYEYNGRIGHTRTNTHPGRRIRVAVDVVPIDR